MSDQLKDKIKEWLEKHGYPLEMQVASAFQDVEFDVVQSVYYQDFESNAARELDVFAYKSFQIGAKWLTFSFVIECKSSKKPWLSFMTDDKTQELNSLNFYSTSEAKRLLNRLRSKYGFYSDLFPSYIGTYAYSLTQALRDSDAPDVTYRAIKTVTKSIESFISKYDSLSGSYYFFYFPVIVVDCPIFEVRLEKDNEIMVEERRQTDYLVRDPKANAPSSIVRIINKSEVKEFAKKCMNDCREFKDRCDPGMLAFL